MKLRKAIEDDMCACGRKERTAATVLMIDHRYEDEPDLKVLMRLCWFCALRTREGFLDGKFMLSARRGPVKDHSKRKVPK